MKKTGFTLIELLAVIVIMAIVMIIGYPIISGIREKAEIKGYEESMRNVLAATEYYMAEKQTDIDETGIEVISPEIKMYKKNFVSGTIIKNDNNKLELIRVTDGVFCSNGTLGDIETVKGSCALLDKTAPINVSLAYSFVSTSKVTLVASGEDFESDIMSYEFSKDNGVTFETPEPMNNVFTFEGLSDNTSYDFIVRITNLNNLSATSASISVTTANLTPPVIDQDVSAYTNGNVIVTATFNQCTSDITCSYSVDGGLNFSELPSSETSVNYTYTTNGLFVVKTSDGTNEIVISRNITNIDKTAPSCISSGGNTSWSNGTITLTGACSDSESGCVSNITKNYSSEINSSLESPGTVYDNVGNSTTCPANQTVKIDKTIPSVAFGTNGSSTPAKTRSTLVTFSDLASGINATSLKYVWTTSSTAPSDASFTNTFINGSNVTSPSALNGTYYLWVMGSDNAGNSVKVKSNSFILDNTNPVITVTPTSITRTISTTAYTDSGVTATDSVSGTLTSSIVTTGTVNSRIAGTYTLTYTVSDVAGNTATATRTVTYNGYTEYRYRDYITSCSTCYQTCTSSTSATVSYSCPSGYSLSGTTCTSSYSIYTTYSKVYACDTQHNWYQSSYSCSGNCNTPCPSPYSNTGGGQTSDSCPSGYCSTVGQTTNCSTSWQGTCSASTSATANYSCPGGYYRSGSTCYYDYSCNPYSCNCSSYWGSWSSWSTTVRTASGTRQVETRLVTSI